MGLVTQYARIRCLVASRGGRKCVLVAEAHSNMRCIQVFKVASRMMTKVLWGNPLLNLLVAASLLHSPLPAAGVCLAMQGCTGLCPRPSGPCRSSLPCESTAAQSSKEASNGRNLDHGRLTQRQQTCTSSCCGCSEAVVEPCTFPESGGSSLSGFICQAHLTVKWQRGVGATAGHV